MVISHYSKNYADLRLIPHSCFMSGRLNNRGDICSFKCALTTEVSYHAMIIVLYKHRNKVCMC